MAGRQRELKWREAVVARLHYGDAFPGYSPPQVHRHGTQFAMIIMNSRSFGLASSAQLVTLNFICVLEHIR
jgi:hypothetical protein